MDPDTDLIDEITGFERKYEEDPHGLVFARLADAYRKAGSLERGLQIVREGLHRHPDYLNARIVHARILRDLGRSRDAAQAFEHVVELDGQSMVALRALGDLARESGDIEGAAAWYMRLLELEPLDDQIRRFVDAVADRSGPEATPAAEPPPVLEELAVLEPPSAAELVSATTVGSGESIDPVGRDDPLDLATATMARLYVAQGLYGDAIRIYDRLLAAAPEDAGVRARRDEAVALAAGDRTAEPDSAPPPDPGPSGSVVREVGVEATRTRGRDLSRVSDSENAGRARARERAFSLEPESSAADPADELLEPGAPSTHGETIREHLQTLVTGNKSVSPGVDPPPDP